MRGLDERPKDETAKLGARLRRSQHAVSTGICMGCSLQSHFGRLERPWLHATGANDVIMGRAGKVNTDTEIRFPGW